MNKKDVLELKSRYKKTGCTFTKMCGCYVNADREKVLSFQETFLNLEEEEFFKYLEIAKKTLSGAIGNHLLELEFPMEEEQSGGKQQFLMGLRESKLKNEELLDVLYERIMESYDYAGNYLILVFHDAYDVMRKTSDNSRLDESEEVYEYLIVSICPVTLTKPGLGYLAEEQRIGPRNRDWVVGVPDTGFIFPAFTERSADIHATLFYSKNPKEPHKEIMDLVLGCPVKSTGAEQKDTFHSIIKNAIADSEETKKVILDIQEGLSQMIEEEETVILTSQSVQEILEESGLEEEIVTKIERAYEENFNEEPPVVDHLLDKKILAENEKRKVEKALMEQVETLKERLEQVTNSTPASEVVLQVPPEKMEYIKTEIIDGKKCIIIPLEENEQATINGKRDLE